MGGYYAARLGILQKLESMHRQASTLTFRFITDEYYIPLGVWVVREAVRKTLGNKPIHFDSQELMIKFAKALINRKYNYDIDNLLTQSIILKEIKNQKKLTNFI